MDIFPKTEIANDRTCVQSLVEDKANKLIDAMMPLTEDERTMVFHFLESNFCQYCGQVLGGEQKKCHCMNDE